MNRAKMNLCAKSVCWAEEGHPGPCMPDGDIVTALQEAVQDVRGSNLDDGAMACVWAALEDAQRTILWYRRTFEPGRWE